ncbi:MAG: hypothetical protein IRZ28_18330 [Steroidobacteraceae bacterium]|nr:hypothetical protein [Steroidobacteraceae bacterium]
MRVISLELHLERDALESKDVAVLCQRWKLTEADVLYFFVNATPITGEEWHALYDVMDCDYRGQIELGGETYDFSINGVSFGVISTTTQPVAAEMYGCMSQCAHLFPFG